MNHLASPALWLAFVVMVACGGDSKPIDKPVPPAGNGGDGDGAGHHESGEHEGEHDDHGDMPAEMKAFHDVLSAYWHGAKGEADTKAVCDAKAQWVELATAVAKSNAPAGADSERYSGSANNLSTAIDSFAAACPDVEEAGRFLSNAHDYFEEMVANIKQAQ